MQKNRFKYKPKTKFKLRFGEYGLIIIEEGRLEFVQLNFVKKAVKFIMRSSKHVYGNYKKVWYNVVHNHIIQCKSKNSRMGKGKGLFERRIVRVSKNTLLFEFIGVPFFKLNFFVKKINKKLGIKTYLLYDKKKSYKILSSNGFVTFYYNKLFKYE